MCDMNTIRSPMAAALLARRAGPACHVASAGIFPGAPDGFTVAAMREIGIDLSDHQPHTLEDLAGTSFDLVITLSEMARVEVHGLGRDLCLESEHWVVDDPSIVRGSREAVLVAYRTTRDILRRRIEQRFPAP